MSHVLKQTYYIQEVSIMAV